MKSTARRHQARRARGERGFTLLELMIVIVVIGILVGIMLPNFSSMQDRAREAQLRGNMRALHLALEDFAVLHDDTFPTAADKAEVRSLMIGGIWPDNPFTTVPLTDAEVPFGADPAAPGEMGANPVTSTGYVVKGYGRNGLLLWTMRS